MAPAEVKAIVLKLGRVRESAELRVRGNTLVVALGELMLALRSRYPSSTAAVGDEGTIEDNGEGANTDEVEAAAMAAAAKETEGRFGLRLTVWL